MSGWSFTPFVAGGMFLGTIWGLAMASLAGVPREVLQTAGTALMATIGVVLFLAALVEYDE